MNLMLSLEKRVMKRQMYLVQKVYRSRVLHMLPIADEEVVLEPVEDDSLAEVVAAKCPEEAIKTSPEMFPAAKKLKKSRVTRKRQHMPLEVADLIADIAPGSSEGLEVVSRTTNLAIWVIRTKTIPEMEDHLEAEDAAVGVVVLEAVVCEVDEASEVDTAEEDFVAVEEEVDLEAAEVAEEAEEVAVEAKPMVKAARKSNSRKNNKKTSKNIGS